MKSGRLLFAVLVAIFSHGSLQAQDIRFNDKGADGESAFDYAVNDLVTQSIVKDLRAVRVECLQIEVTYRLDCLRQGLELTSRRTPFHGDYGPMRQALYQGARGIAPVISANSDRNQPRLEVKPGTNPRFKARRYYTYAAIDAGPDARTSAFASLDDARSRLLESANKSTNWNRHYTAVAIALASLSDALRQ